MVLVGAANEPAARREALLRCELTNVALLTVQYHTARLADVKFGLKLKAHAALVHLLQCTGSLQRHPRDIAQPAHRTNFSADSATTLNL